MLRAFTPRGSETVTGAGPLPDGTVWIDMVDPTPAEEALVEAAAGIQVPTRDEMVEIETSSRLYQQDDAIYLTCTLVTGIINANPETHDVGFVLTDRLLVTVRYADIRSFARFAAHAERNPVLCESAGLALMHLLEAVVDRLADGIEHVGREVDAISRQAFRRAREREQKRLANIALKHLLVRLGSAQDALSKARESTVSLSRALGFLAFAAPKAAGLNQQIKTLSRDLGSIGDHAGYLAGNIAFLLEASLGLISIEQNSVLKMFSVAAIVFMPPTLIAGIYGMNFEFMPELHWHLGYPWALGLMLLSAVLPFVVFRWRGWL